MPRHSAARGSLSLPDFARGRSSRWAVPARRNMRGRMSGSKSYTMHLTRQGDYVDENNKREDGAGDSEGKTAANEEAVSCLLYEAVYIGQRILYA